MNDERLLVRLAKDLDPEGSQTGHHDVAVLGDEGAGQRAFALGEGGHGERTVGNRFRTWNANLGVHRSSGPDRERIGNDGLSGDFRCLRHAKEDSTRVVDTPPRHRARVRLVLRKRRLGPRLGRTLSP